MIIFFLYVFDKKKAKAIHIRNVRRSENVLSVAFFWRGLFQNSMGLLRYEFTIWWFFQYGLFETSVSLGHIKLYKATAFQNL
jgi:uncharacterized membrane protein YsdA (DUF1294 family)